MMGLLRFIRDLPKLDNLTSVFLLSNLYIRQIAYFYAKQYKFFDGYLDYYNSIESFLDPSYVNDGYIENIEQGITAWKTLRDCKDEFMDHYEQLQKYFGEDNLSKIDKDYVSGFLKGKIGTITEDETMEELDAVFFGCTCSC